MRKAIENFNKQFEYEPAIINQEKLGEFNKFIIAGMGGSNLVADLIRIADPAIDIIRHRDYGLPFFAEKESKERLFIASSYSGNTEETIDSLEVAIKAGFNCCVVASGGKLIDMAKEHGLPYIVLPNSGIQPRMAIGLNLLAILKIINREDLLNEVKELSSSLNPLDFEQQGKELAKDLQGFTPVIYSSLRNMGVAYNWKIKFNETGKIPAFYNIVPELNHNEMTGFDVADSTKKLSENFYFLFLKDAKDNPKHQKRMEVLEKLYSDRNLKVKSINLQGDKIFYKIFSSLLLADWTALYLAEFYGVEAEKVPMVEEFKKLI